MVEAAFLGVFSASVHGGMARRRQLFFVWSREDGHFDIQRLDGAYHGVGKVYTITIDDLRSQFMYEPKVLAVPEGYRRPGTPEEAPAPPAPDPVEVENTLREHFRKAMLRLKRPSARAAAREALETLVQVEEGIEPVHRFMFADFGVDLRKGSELGLALAFCQRVLQFAPDDDHAHFNIARVLLEQGKYDEAEEHARTAMALEPEEPIHRKLLEYIQLERRRHQRPQRR